ncbi:hypothetical protein ABVK25_012272 [Lepraria finkii]|uniref:Uncharacterized protein n=1 Tax=Lepraria finkii TaxID=1340010 RepID=A0ABR4AFR3_9LECA
MRFVIFCLATCVSVVLAAPSDIANRNFNNAHRALYTLDNDPSGSKILALALDGQTGQVSSPTLTSTGGNGLLGLNIGTPFGAAGTSAGPDALFGQGAVVVSQNYLFVVNPGSHTLSLFVIRPWDPLHPQLVGRPVDTQGDFPTSVDYSVRRHRVACVLNGGSQGRTYAGVTGPPGTGSQVSFNPDGSAVLVTIKGAPGPPAVSGSLGMFSVNRRGDVSATAVVSDRRLDYGLQHQFLGSNTVAMITDPTFGAAFVTIGSDLTVTETKHISCPWQGAACWGAYSRRYDAAYVVDAGHPNITVLDPTSGATKGVISYDAASKGGFDTVIDRQWLYALTGDSSMLVVQLHGNGGQQAQKLSLADYGTAGHWQGLAAWPLA